MGAPVADLLSAAPLERADGRCAFIACLVVSVDGRAAIDGRVGALTGDADQALLRGLRERADAVVASGATVRAEGYGRPLIDDGDEPALVVVSPSGEVGDEAEPDAVLTTIDDLLAHARERGWSVVTVEGGPSLVARAVAGGLLDELVVSVSPQLVGDPQQPTLLGDAALATRELRLVFATAADGHVLTRWALR